MDDYKIPNNILRSIEQRVESQPIRLYQYITFWIGVVTQLYIVVKLFK